VATLPTFEDLQDAGRQEALVRPTRIQREALETPTSDVAIFLAASTAIGQDAALYGQTEVNAARLATALSVSTEALEQWGAGNYGVPREGASAARVPVEFRRDPSAASFTIPGGSVVGTSGGVTFRTAVDAIFPASSVGPLAVTAIASTAGRGGNVGAGTITNVLGGPDGPLEDRTITVTNPEPAAGGAEDETEDEYQARLQAFFPAARKGTLQAIQTDTEALREIESATATELVGEDGFPVGRVEVAIIGANSQANSSLAALVRETLEDTRAAGIGVVPKASQPTYVSISITGLGFASGVNTTIVLNNARLAVVAAVNENDPNKPLRRGLIISTLEQVEDLVVPSAAIDTLIPADDVEPTVTGEVFRTREDLVSLN
jgi:uncharacterized phage protein gp47/JayE